VDGTILAPIINYTGTMSLNAISEATALKGRVTDTTNNSAARAVYIQHRLSSGTPVAGFGAAIEFDADDTTTQDSAQARIFSRWIDPAHATRTSELALGVNTLGSGGMTDILFLRNLSARLKLNVSLVMGDSALATNATDGFIYLGSCPGTPTGTPTTQTGTVPFIWDSTHNILYAYYGGAWQPQNMGQGTSFPGSPITNQTFFRTDLNVWCEYNGTRWLGPRQTMTLSFSDNGNPKTYTAGNTIVGRFAPPEKGTYWIDNITWRGRVDTTSSILKFWTLRFGVENFSLGGSAECDVNTSTQTAGANWAIDGVTFTNNPYDFAATNFDMYLEARISGTPGQLNVYGANLIMRRVYT
jgi:hypothetical protein